MEADADDEAMAADAVVAETPDEVLEDTPAPEAKRASKRKHKPLTPYEPPESSRAPAAAAAASAATSAASVPLEPQQPESAKKRRRTAGDAGGASEAKSTTKRRSTAAKPGVIPEPAWSRRLRDVAREDVDQLLVLALAVQQHGGDWSLVSAKVGRSPQECKQLFATMCLARPPVLATPDDEYNYRVNSTLWQFSTLVQPFSAPNWWAAEVATPSPPPQPASPVSTALSEEQEQNAFSLWAVTAVGKYPDETALVAAWVALPQAMKVEFVRHSQKEQSFKSLWNSMVKPTTS